MAFILLPAVDVAAGEAVRLVRGQADTGTITSDPLDAALAWQAEGAEWIHLVDLDAAFGRGSNAALLASMIDQLTVRVELSGGIRDDASLDRALATGCDRAILATDALADLAWCKRVIGLHGDRIAVGLDVRIVERTDGSAQHQLAARGGGGIVGDLFTTIERLDAEGCRRYVITDVSKDGMLAGPNLELYRAVADATSTPIIASGGVSEIGDLVTMADAAAGATIEGSIVGHALYAGRFTLAEALAAIRQVEAAKRR